MSNLVVKRADKCNASGGAQGAKCERRKGHAGGHMGSPKRNGKRVATEVVEWGGS